MEESIEVAHFAELNNENTVIRVVVISNDDLLDSNGEEKESLGILTCKNIYGKSTKWVQTSYNGSFRKQYAGKGCTYDVENDIFILPQPYNSFVLDENFDWVPPIEYPEDGKNYYWDEETLSWIEVE